MFFGIYNEGFGSSFEGFKGSKVDHCYDNKKNNSPLAQKAKEINNKYDSSDLDKPISNYVKIKESLDLLNESYQVIDSKAINFNGTKATIKIKTDDPNSKLLSKVDSVLKTVCSSALYNYLYTLDKNFYDGEINNDPYYDGKAINSGSDLMNAIKEQINHKNACIFLDSSRNLIYFCGEYWVDEEHGYSIVFPGGKFIKGKLGDKKTDSKHIPQFTYMGLYSDAL